jgi:hypothetical protein
MTDALATLDRGTGGEITFWSTGMEQRYGFSSKDAVGQVADHLLKTIFSQTRHEIQTALAESYTWSGGLVHRHANGRLMLTANHWQTRPAVADRGAYVTEVHSDIIPAGAAPGGPLADLLDQIASELIGSLTAISTYNAASDTSLQSSKPVSEKGHVARSLAAVQIGRNAKAVHLLQDVVSALRGPEKPLRHYGVTPTGEVSNEEHRRLMEDSLKTMEQSARIMQQSSDLISDIHSYRIYRIYLIDTNGHIEAAESFSAPNDDAAADVAGSVHEASSDVFTGYELWAEGQCISSVQSGHAKAAKKRNLEVAIQKHQDTVVDLEEKLQRAFACVKRSRKLLLASTEIRDQMRASSAEGTPPSP